MSCCYSRPCDPSPAWLKTSDLLWKGWTSSLWAGVPGARMSWAVQKMRLRLSEIPGQAIEGFLLRKPSSMRETGKWVVKTPEVLIIHIQQQLISKTDEFTKACNLDIWK